MIFQDLLDSMISTFRTARTEFLIIILSIFCLVFLLLVFLGIALLLTRQIDQVSDDPMEFRRFWRDYVSGLSTEFAGAVVTTVLLGLLALYSQQLDAIRDRRGELRTQVTQSESAFETFRILRSYDWLQDGTVRELYFEGLELQQAVLISADFTGSFFRGIDLEEAQLFEAIFTDSRLIEVNMVKATSTSATYDGAQISDSNLSMTDFGGSTFIGAVLTRVNMMNADISTVFRVNPDSGEQEPIPADLTGAKITDSDLRGANLSSAILIGTDLSRTNLSGAIVNDVDRDATTILPDGSTMQALSDLDRFVDPAHPDYYDLCAEFASLNLPHISCSG